MVGDINFCRHESRHADVFRARAKKDKQHAKENNNKGKLYIFHNHINIQSKLKKPLICSGFLLKYFKLF